MADYTVPSIKTKDITETSPMSSVKEILVNSTSDKTNVILKANFTLPISQIIGPVGAMEGQITYENGFYYINT